MIIVKICILAAIPAIIIYDKIDKDTIEITDILTTIMMAITIIAICGG